MTAAVFMAPVLNVIRLGILIIGCKLHPQRGGGQINFTNGRNTSRTVNEAVILAGFNSVLVDFLMGGSRIKKIRRAMPALQVNMFNKKLLHSYGVDMGINSHFGSIVAAVNVIASAYAVVQLAL